MRGNHPATVEGTENASISCYYRCGEPLGTFLENSGRTAAGGPVSALAGQDALITDDFCAAVPLNGAEHARINLADNPTGNDTFSAQIWFRLDKNALSVGRNHVLFEKGDGEPRVYVEEQSSGPNSGRIVFQMRNVGSNTIAVSDSDIIVEETWYHVVVTQTGLSTAVIYVNSVDVTTGTVTPLAVTGTMGLMTLGNSRGGFFDERLGGRVDEFAYWEGVALTQAQVTALYQSVASDRFPAQTTAARIIEVLDQIGLASDARDISVTPQTTLAQHDASDGENTLGHLQDVGLSENGQFCVAADGRVTFQARHERIKVTTVLSTFGDGQNALSDAIADWGVGGSNTIAVSADIDSPPGFTEVWKCTDVAGSGDTNTGLDIGDVTSAGPITALTWVYVPSSYSASMPTVNIASQVSPVFATAQDIRDEWQLVTAIDDHQDDTNLSITLRHGSGGRQAGDFFYVAAAPQLGPPADELSYRDLAPQYDLAGLFTEIVVTLANGEKVTAADPASPFKRRTLPLSVLYNDALEANDLAHWLLDVHKKPRAIFPTIGVVPQNRPSNAMWTAVLSHDISDRIRLLRRPPGGGLPIDEEVYIEGVQHEYAAGGVWVTRFLLSPVE